MKSPGFSGGRGDRPPVGARAGGSCQADGAPARSAAARRMPRARRRRLQGGPGGLGSPGFAFRDSRAREDARDRGAADADRASGGRIRRRVVARAIPNPESSRPLGFASVQALQDCSGSVLPFIGHSNPSRARKRSRAAARAPMTRMLEIERYGCSGEASLRSWNRIASNVVLERHEATWRVANPRHPQLFDSLLSSIISARGKRKIRENGIARPKIGRTR